MTKRFFVPAILCLLVSLVGTSTAVAQFRVGFEGGLNYTFPDWDDEGFVLKDSGKSAPVFGAFLEIPQHDTRSVILGIRYVEEGVAAEFDTGVDDPDGQRFGDLEWTQRYLSIPALIKVRALDSPRLFFTFGVETQVLLAADLKGNESDLINAEPDPFTRIVDWDDDVTDSMKPVNFSLDIGAGIEFPLAGYTGSLEVRFDYGLGRTADDDEFFSNWQTSGLEFLFGVTL